MQAEHSGERSWAQVLGVAVLAACSFAGCARRGADLPGHLELESQAVPAAFDAQEVQSRAVNPADQQFLDQSMKLEKGLQAIRLQSDNDGWHGSTDLRNVIGSEFQSMETAILTRMKGNISPVELSDLKRLYESVHTVGNMFREDALATTGISWYDSATDRTMSHLYGLEAQLILMRVQLTDAAR